MNKNIKTWCSLILSILSLLQEKPIFGDSGELIILNNFQHQGKLCGSGRDIQVWLPPKYNANTDRYPVIYFFDGESVLSGGDGKPGRQTLDMDMAMLTLLAKDLITPAILVTIPNAQGGSHDEQLKKGNKRQDIVNTRQYELSPINDFTLKRNGGGIEDMHHFISQQLKPYIDQKFRTRPETRYTGISGCSRGGFASAWLLAHYPSTYGFAGCFSPAFHVDGGELFQFMTQNDLWTRSSRLWLQMGSKEQVVYLEFVPKLCRTLALQRGMKEGRDIAFLMSRNQGHQYASWKEQAIQMLYFMLWKEPPKPQSLELTPYEGESGQNSLNLLALGEKAHVLPRLTFENDFQLDLMSVDIMAEDKGIITIQEDFCHQILPHSSGNTLVQAQYGSLHSSINVESFDIYKSSDEDHLLKKSSQQILVDGDLREWENLSFSGTGPNCRFDLCYDEKNIYIAVEIFDSNIIVEPNTPPWSQDGLEVRLDCRKMPTRFVGRGRDDFHDVILLATSPTLKGTPCRLQQDYYGINNGIPEGVEIVCNITNNGYIAEMAIPLQQSLIKYQGTSWEGLRFNLTISDFDTLHHMNSKFEWTSDWRSTNHKVGSGMFWKFLQKND